jgi:3-dehydroquinate synthase
VAAGGAREHIPARDVDVRSSRARAARTGDSTRVLLRAGGARSEILIGEGLLAGCGSLAAARLAGRSAVVVSSERIFGLHGAPLLRSLAAAGFRVARATLPDGERAKSARAVSRLYADFLAARLERRSLIVVLGGGVLCDVGGFAAATFLRGLPTLLVPTTLLAQVDAAIGGKTAINLPAGKNLVGVFHQPRLVLCDPATLRTLRGRELRAGLAEVIKIGAVADRGLFALVERELEAILAWDPAAIRRIVTRAVRAKVRIVARDERDLTGRRALLNYGHTIGHAIEASLRYGRLLHGEAVAVGIAAACRLAVRSGVQRPSDAARQTALLARAGLPTNLPRGIELESLLAHAARDKKARNGRVPFVLTPSIGSARLATRIPTRLVSRVLVEMGAEGRGSR